MTDARETSRILPDWSAPANVRAFTTTRTGGFSLEPWASFNLGSHCGDDPQRVMRNRALLKSLLPAGPRWLRQAHGANIVELPVDENTAITADAAFSRVPGQVCAVLTADCLPVLLCDRAGTVVAAVHAGWRGLAAGILESTVGAMGCETGELIAWLGPAIGPRVFEVGKDVFTTFTAVNEANEAAFTVHGDRWLADLYELARLALMRRGVTRVSGGQYCTYTQKEEFFSYRRDGSTGRMATVIWLSADPV